MLLAFDTIQARRPSVYPMWGRFFGSDSESEVGSMEKEEANKETIEVLTRASGSCRRRHRRRLRRNSRTRPIPSCRRRSWRRAHRRRRWLASTTRRRPSRRRRRPRHRRRCPPNCDQCLRRSDRRGPVLRHKKRPARRSVAAALDSRSSALPRGDKAPKASGRRWPSDVARRQRSDKELNQLVIRVRRHRSSTPTRIGARITTAIGSGSRCTATRASQPPRSLARSLAATRLRNLHQSVDAARLPSTAAAAAVAAPPAPPAPPASGGSFHSTFIRSNSWRRHKHCRNEQPRPPDK